MEINEGKALKARVDQIRHLCGDNQGEQNILRLLCLHNLCFMIQWAGDIR